MSDVPEHVLARLREMGCFSAVHVIAMTPLADADRVVDILRADKTWETLEGAAETTLHPGDKIYLVPRGSYVP